MNQDLKKTLWAAADKLRSSMDAAEYKHIVLGLIFVKYISDAFDERRGELRAAFRDEAGDLYLSVSCPSPRRVCTTHQKQDCFLAVFPPPHHFAYGALSAAASSRARIIKVW